MSPPMIHSVSDTGHPLHRQWQVLLQLLQQAQVASPSMCAEDCRRAAAQLLMEVVLRQFDAVDQVRLDAGGNLHARCRTQQRQRWIWLDARQATAYRVEEVSAALDEACRAWNIAVHRRYRGEA
ncbi:hypothetical protein [Stenotrophomonas ginsengisoli]|nr:hypothetical protein [Stenotrophomonas ginsengisoli]